MRLFLVSLFTVVTMAVAAVVSLASSEYGEAIAPSPLYQQRLDEMALQFEGKRGADTRVRAGINDQQAFFFPSEAVSACAGSACVASACGASGCAASGCAASGCAGSACGGSGCAGSVCGGSGCAGSACIGSGCGLSGCAGSACSQSACVGSACGQSACVGSACAGCNSRLNTEPGYQLASLQGDVIQASCPFTRDQTRAVAQIAGFEVSESDGMVDINWIANGSNLQTYRVIGEAGGARKVFVEGRAASGLMQTVSAPTLAGDAVYTVEVTDSAGWTIAVRSTGETLRTTAAALN